jgi:hypothetical protein
MPERRQNGEVPALENNLRELTAAAVLRLLQLLLDPI